MFGVISSSSKGSSSPSGRIRGTGLSRERSTLGSGEGGNSSKGGLACALSTPTALANKKTIIMNAIKMNWVLFWVFMFPPRNKETSH
jgi:hypothetical protein